MKELTIGHEVRFVYECKASDFTTAINHNLNLGFSVIVDTVELATVKMVRPGSPVSCTKKEGPDEILCKR